MNFRWTSLGDKKFVSDLSETLKHTTESSTGRKILTVLTFDVTSVKRPLITITIIITAALGIPSKHFNACATLSDKPELLSTEKIIYSYDYSIDEIQTVKADAIARPAPSKNITPHEIFFAKSFHWIIGAYFQSPYKQKTC